MYKAENMYVYKVREMRGTFMGMAQTFIPNECHCLPGGIP